MADLLQLNTMELDALRETANIGAGHAATALSQMTGNTIMITRADDHDRRARGCAVAHSFPEEEPIVAVLMQMMGDLTGRTLLVFPHPTAIRLAQLMLRRPTVPTRRSVSSSSPRSRKRAIF